MSSRFSFFRPIRLALLCASLPCLLSAIDESRGFFGDEKAPREQDEYRKLFSTLLNPNGIDLNELGSDSKAVSVIGMFSDEKLSGSELQVMHWVDFKAADNDEEHYIIPEADSVKKRIRAKQDTLRGTIDEKRLQAEERVYDRRSRLDKRVKEDTQRELRMLKEKARRSAEERLVREEEEDLMRMQEIESKLKRQEEESIELSQLELDLQRRELERRRQLSLEMESDSLIEDAQRLDVAKKKRLSSHEIFEEARNDANVSEELDSESPLFQGSLWRIPGNRQDKFAKDARERVLREGRHISELDVEADRSMFSANDSVSVLESLDKFDRHGSNKRGLSKRSKFGRSYPNWAFGSRLLERALDSCRSTDEYLVLAFCPTSGMPFKEMIAKDLQKYGIPAAKIRESVSLFECAPFDWKSDRKVKDLLVMSGIANGSGYIVIELLPESAESGAKIVRVSSLSKDFQSSRMLSCRTR